jgi:hypothetical protein
LRPSGTPQELPESHNCVWRFADGSIASLATVGIPNKAVEDLPLVGKVNPITVGRHSGVQAAEIIAPDECEVDLNVGPKMTLGVLVVGAGTSDAACGRALQGARIVEAELP